PDEGLHRVETVHGPVRWRGLFGFYKQSGRGCAVYPPGPASYSDRGPSIPDGHRWSNDDGNPRGGISRRTAGPVHTQPLLGGGTRRRPAVRVRAGGQPRGRLAGAGPGTAGATRLRQPGGGAGRGRLQLRGRGRRDRVHGRRRARLRARLAGRRRVLGRAALSGPHRHRRGVAVRLPFRDQGGGADATGGLSPIPYGPVQSRVFGYTPRLPVLPGTPDNG